jgi:hypothetical protein
VSGTSLFLSVSTAARVRFQINCFSANLINFTIYLYYQIKFISANSIYIFYFGDEVSLRIFIIIYCGMNVIFHFLCTHTHTHKGFTQNKIGMQIERWMISIGRLASCKYNTNERQIFIILMSVHKNLICFSFSLQGVLYNK